MTAVSGQGCRIREAAKRDQRASQVTLDSNTLFEPAQVQA